MTIQIEEVLPGGDFAGAMDRMATVGGFVAHRGGNMTWAIYRPQLSEQGTIGRFLGVLQHLHVEPLDIKRLLAGSDSRVAPACEWCSFPNRTGFANEADQRTPRCTHGIVTVNCLCCGGTSEFTLRDTPFCRSCGDAERLAARPCEVGHLLDSTGRCVPCDTYAAQSVPKDAALAVRVRDIAYREHLRVKHKLHRSDKRPLTDADIEDFALSRTGYPPKYIHCDACTAYAIAVGYTVDPVPVAQAGGQS